MIGPGSAASLTSTAGTGGPTSGQQSASWIDYDSSNDSSTTPPVNSSATAKATRRASSATNSRIAGMVGCEF